MKAGHVQPSLDPQWDLSSQPELRLRIELLRRKAHLRAGKATDATCHVAIVLFLGGMWLMFLALMVNAASLFNFNETLGITLSIAIPIMVSAYGIYVLASSHLRLDRYFAQTLGILRDSSMGIVLAHEEYWRELFRRHSKQHQLFPSDRPTLDRIEDQLTWCAYHFKSLERCFQRQETNLTWRYARERLIHSMWHVYRLPPLLFGCGGCAILLVLPFLVPLHAAFCWLGSHQIIAQARLMAICDFLLSEGVNPNDVGWD